jgi:hypothetical protein
VLAMMLAHAAFCQDKPDIPHPAIPGNAISPPASVPATFPAGSLHFTWDAPDHLSGIYHVKDDASLTVQIDNTSGQAAEILGDILFGSRSAGGDFKIISVIPVAAATLSPGERAKIPLKMTFGAAGPYELRWRQGDHAIPIAAANGLSLQCIFAPRAGKAAEESPWITTLPRAAIHPGYLSDDVRQTAVRRFLIDERFTYDLATNVGLGLGASLGVSGKDADAMFAEAAKCNAELLLRVTVPIGMSDPKTVSAFKEYLTDGIRRGKGTLTAIAILPASPDGGAVSEAQRRNYVTLYLAGYQAAKSADKKMLMLGAGSQRLTAEWLLTPDAKLLSYVDAMAITDAAAEVAFARQITGERKIPFFLLPPASGTLWPPAAAGLTAGAALVAVPPPNVDNGVTEHLLGGAVMLQRVQVSVASSDPNGPQSTKVPFAAVFQGDGYSLAAVAGFSAGTELDAAFPSLARTRTQVDLVKPNDDPATPNLEIGDDTRAMRVVDAAGAPVDCRVGDNVFVPATDKVVYLIHGGSAEELAGMIRPADPNHLPIFDLQLIPTPQAAPDINWTLHLQNIATRETAGTVRLINPPAAGESPAILAEKDFAAISPGKTMEVPLELAAKLSFGTIVVEITTKGAKAVIQRTALVINGAEISRPPPH